ncbi:hypothetical protein [Streptomyces sp. NPDC058385]|uniref:hypothetical protein n=1 Tax=Streptomyces sp. NPDC058385 TaxID=3346473 RepID=UPI003658EF87
MRGPTSLRIEFNLDTVHTQRSASTSFFSTGDGRSGSWWSEAGQRRADVHDASLEPACCLIAH